MSNNTVKYKIAFRNINGTAKLVLIELFAGSECILALCEDADWEKLRKQMPVNTAPTFLLKHSYSIMDTIPECSIEGGVQG